MLEVTDLNVLYGGLHVLHGLSFTVRLRGITTIVGPNGAGKSTTLNTVAGLIKPTSGFITLEGQPIVGFPAHEVVARGFILAPEGRKLFGSMTVLENLEMGAYLKNSRQRISDTLEWIYQIFPFIKERKNQRASTLSGGEQQMLAIARALMSRPKLLALDEPSQGLAPKARAMIFKTIDELSNNFGLPILLIEQTIYDALAISSYSYLLRGGRIALEGDPQELYKDKFVEKDYLGL